MSIYVQSRKQPILSHASARERCGRRRERSSPGNCQYPSTARRLLLGRTFIHGADGADSESSTNRRLSGWTCDIRRRTSHRSADTSANEVFTLRGSGATPRQRISLDDVSRHHPNHSVVRVIDAHCRRFIAQQQAFRAANPFRTHLRARTSTSGHRRARNSPCYSRTHVGIQRNGD
jgi:hypothetical protein